MDLQQKVAELAEELGYAENKMHYVIGITESNCKKALEGSDQQWVDKTEVFFNDREYAMSIYTEPEFDLIRSFEKLVIESKGQGKAAARVGLNPSVISNLRRGKYAGSKSEAFEKLQNYFEAKTEKEKMPDVFVPVEYAPTTISQLIYERLRNVHVLGGCAVITGDSGIGKTKTIQKYFKDNRTNTIVITASVFNHNVNDVLYLLANELGIHDTNSRRIKNAVFSKLHDGMIIIVDEAQELTYSAANALRSIPDYFEAKGETLGLAFVGNPCFYKKFNGRYTSDRVQVSSRFVSEPTYTAEQIQFEDTKLLYPQLTSKNMIAELMFLHSIATIPTLGQRKALHIFKNAYLRGKYDLDALVQRAKESRVKFDNLNEILKRIKENV